MILGIDSTTERLHLALADPADAARTCSVRVDVGVGRSHSGALLPAVQALLDRAGLDASALTGVAACLGPGGFTSLRIGVATVEGLSLTGLPTWGFSAFRLRARALREAGVAGPVWILLDGQRQEAFAQPWDDGPLAPAAKVPLAGVADLVGDGAWWAPEAFAGRVAAHLPHGPVALEDEGEATLAGLAGLCRTLAGTPPEPGLVPFYLRETDAEVKFPEASAHLSEALRRGIAP